MLRTSTHIGTLRKYTNGVILVTLLLCKSKMRLNHNIKSFRIHMFNPPASEASREVANLTARINPHTPVYGVKF